MNESARGPGVSVVDNILVLVLPILNVCRQCQFSARSHVMVYEVQARGCISAYLAPLFSFLFSSFFSFLFFFLSFLCVPVT